MNSLSFVLAVSLLARLRGLLGPRPRWKANTILVLAPCKSIHTWWMLYPIDVAFVDKGGIVLSARREVAPWRVLSDHRACFVLERPCFPDSPWFEKGDTVPILSYSSL